MKKKALAVLTLAFITISLLGCSKAVKSNIYLDMMNNNNSDKKVLFLSESQSKDYPTTKGDYEFAKLVGERTNGKIEVKVVPNGGLGSEKDTLSQTQMGTIDFCRVSLSAVSNYSDIMTILMLPYIYRDSDHMWSVLNGSIGMKALDDIKKANLLGLTFYDSGARNFYNNKKEIKTVADLKSLRIRVQESELMKSLVTSLGATPTAMDSNIVMQSLALGTIDGAENNPATYVSTNQLSVAKYYTFDSHSRVPDILIASSKVMDSLSQEDQKIIKQAALDSVKVQKAEWKSNEDKMINTMKEKGVKITEIDEAAKEEFKNAVKPLYDKFAGQNKDLLNQIEQTK